eukprot:4426254-Prymnesium_polylepis.1
MHTPRRRPWHLQRCLVGCAFGQVCPKRCEVNKLCCCPEQRCEYVTGNGRYVRHRRGRVGALRGRHMATTY